MQRNPGLAAARWRVEEARGRLTQAGRPPNPELELGFTSRTREGENAFGVSAAVRAGDHIQFDGGIALGTGESSVGGRAGATVTW